MNPAHILEAVRSTYAGCRSYSDRGRVLPGNRYNIELPESSFRTAFSRLGDFIFEWSDGKSRELIWTKRNFAFIMSEDQHRHAVGSAQIAIASVMGISMGSADNILPLLLKAGIGSVLDLKNLSVERSDSDDYIIHGTLYNAEIISLSIQRDSFLLRRITREMNLTPDFQARLYDEAEADLFRLREEGKLSEERFKEFLGLHHASPQSNNVVTHRTEFVFDQVLINGDDSAMDSATDPDFELFV